MPVRLRRAAQCLREKFSCSRHRVLRADREGVSSYKVSALNAQPAGDVGDRLQRRAYPSVLDVADVATAVDWCSNLLLGQTESDTVVTDPFTEPRRDP